MTGVPTSVADSIAQVVSQAGLMRRTGKIQEARNLLEPLAGQHPRNATVLNALALVWMDQEPGLAAELLTRATALEPEAESLQLNLADARRRLGDTPGQIAALDAALALNPYSFPALAGKATALEQTDRPAAARIYRALSTAYANNDDDRLKPMLSHARRIIEEEDERRSAEMQPLINEVMASYEAADWSRASVFTEVLGGRRRIFPSRPSGSHFPFLPAYEFFPRHYFPWLKQLEAATAKITAEYLALRLSVTDHAQPYVQMAAGMPVNQWRQLNHSTDWSAIFLWKDGIEQAETVARCPQTVSLLRKLPLLDVPGKSPTAMFSVLAPGTRIPPHTGSTNIRTTVHLALDIPDGCGFRVGGETRQWSVGQAFAFDDTIEHEAWNDSDRERCVLIVDVWNPLLSEAERALCRALRA